MAITATVTVNGPGGNNSGTVIANQTCNVNLAIVNGNTTAAQIQSITPQIRATNSSNTFTQGLAGNGINLGNAINQTVLPSSTLNFNWDIVFPSSSSFPAVPAGTINAAPAAGNNNGTVNSNNTYDVGATIVLQDLTTPTTLYVVSPTVTTVTVNAIAIPCSN